MPGERPGLGELYTFSTGTTLYNWRHPDHFGTGAAALLSFPVEICLFRDAVDPSGGACFNNKKGVQQPAEILSDANCIQLQILLHSSW
jgi:hypothetical protein